MLQSLSACLADAPLPDPFATLLPPPATFRVDPSRDTVLTTPGGLEVHLTARTLRAGPDGTVEVTVEEALDPVSALLSGLSSVDARGRLLGSGGAFALRFSPEQSPSRPPLVELPADGLATGTRHYIGRRSDSGDLLWEEAGALANDSLLRSVIAGGALFAEHCSSCHNDSLCCNLTGPALGNVHRVRTREWLTEWTLNSQAMIASGDPDALCLWAEWGPTVMSSFEDELTGDEIGAIYDWIASESLRLGIEDGEVRHATAPCPVRPEPGPRAWRKSVVAPAIAPRDIIRAAPEPDHYAVMSETYGWQTIAWYRVDEAGVPLADARHVDIPLVGLPAGYSEARSGLLFDAPPGCVVLDVTTTGRLTLRDWMGDLRLPRRAVAISVVANEAGWYYGEREVDPGLAAPQRMPVSAIAETELIARLADLRRRLEPMQVTLDQPNPCCKDRGAYE